MEDMVDGRLLLKSVESKFVELLPSNITFTTV